MNAFARLVLNLTLLLDASSDIAACYVAQRAVCSRKTSPKVPLAYKCNYVILQMLAKIILYAIVLLLGISQVTEYGNLEVLMQNTFYIIASQTNLSF